MNGQEVKYFTNMQTNSYLQVDLGIKQFVQALFTCRMQKGQVESFCKEGAYSLIHDKQTEKLVTTIQPVILK
jgi:hypothetical protein